jgi:anaerobic selenocysteine-containing dehydrogenase
MAIETKKSFCRMCHAFCAIDVDVDTELNQVVAVRGDAENPIFGGYTCIKGRQLPDQHNHPGRLRTSLKRMPDGSFQPISSEQALDEIAAKLQQIIARDGPRAVATYNGTYAYLYAGLLTIAKAWHKGIGSPMFTNSASIDQPGKGIAMMRHGMWAAGDQGFDSSDVMMMVGCNPVVSMFAGIKFPAYNPWKRIQDAKKRGLKLIVVDPRKSEVAKRADLHLQVRPGEDPTLLAGIIHVILEEGLYDGDFVQAYVAGVEELRDTVKDFTPEYVEERAGVPAQHVREAARMFANAKRGSATSGTGPSMAPRSNLSEQLITTINTLCGRYLREGEVIPNPGTLTPLMPRYAQPVGGAGVPLAGEKSRVKGIQAYMPDGDVQTTVLADEILTPGAGQVKALISIAGNPVSAWPDQLKTIEAMKALELNVTIDIKMSSTAKLCDYIIAPKLSLERPDFTALPDQWFPQPYAQYAAPAVNPTDDLIEEWEFFWGLARRMGTEIVLPGGPMPFDHKPTSDEWLDMLAAGSRVPLDEVRKHPGGALFPVEVRVQARRPDATAKLQAGEAELLAELREVRSEPVTASGSYAGMDGDFSHRLISRRMREVNNSSARDLPQVLKMGLTYNPAYMNPVDLAELGVNSGDLVEIASDRASILGVVEATDDVPSGVISMSHSWGDTPENDHLVRSIGSSTNRLVNLDAHWEKYTGMAWQSAIPVNVKPAKEPVGV